MILTYKRLGELAQQGIVAVRAFMPMEVGLVLIAVARKQPDLPPVFLTNMDVDQARELCRFIADEAPGTITKLDN